MTGSASLVSVSVRTAAAAAPLLALGIALNSCGESEEDVAPQPTATASPAPTDPASPAPLRATATTAPVPSGWTSYTDPLLGFSLQYPSDLAVTDKGSSSSTGDERDLEFRSAGDPPRLVLVVAMVENNRGLTLDQWVLEYAACLPETVEQNTLAGKNALFCTSAPAEVPEAAVAFEHKGMMFLIRSLMPPAEFDLLIASLRL